MALWEAGAPWEIDESDLSTHGMYAFSEETRGVPFSAHPRIEPDGTLWNVGYASSANLLVLWHIGSDGKIKKMGKVAASPITMVHDFVVTERHIVVLFAPFHYEHRDAPSFLQAHQWHPADPTRVLVVDKNDFSTYRWLELPAQWVFHFGNAWEDKDGVIRFDAASYEDPFSYDPEFSRNHAREPNAGWQAATLWIPHRYPNRRVFTAAAIWL
jgi:carotenoid cleavage dioxygenase